MPSMASSCSGVISASASTVVMPAALQLPDQPFAQASYAFQRIGCLRGHGGHLRLDLLPLLFLALDVDVPHQKLGGQPHVLAFLADGQRQLGVIDDDFQVLLAACRERRRD